MENKENPTQQSNKNHPKPTDDVQNTIETVVPDSEEANLDLEETNPDSKEAKPLDQNQDSEHNTEDPKPETSET